MTFLNSAILGGIVAAAGIPLVIHILNKRFPKLFEFSSVALLRETAAQRSRIFKWRHRILTILRTLFLAMLIAAFLKPVLPKFGGLAAADEGRRIVIVFDHSLSMEHKGGGQSPRQRAVTAADQVLAGLGARDVCNIVLAGNTASTAFFEWTRDHAAARDFLRNLLPAAGSADFTLANNAVGRLVGASGGNVEIYYFSDFQRKNWAGADFTPIATDARLFFNGGGDIARENRAVLSAAPAQTAILAGDTLTLEVELGNYASQPLQAPVRVTINGGATFEKDAFCGPWSSTKITLPIPAGKSGLHLCEISLPPDELPGDDRFHLVLNVAEKENILLVSDDPAESAAPRFLKTALNPYDKLAGTLIPEPVNAAALTPARLASVRKVVLARAGALSEEAAQQLGDFVFQGGGLLWFLDGDGDLDTALRLRKTVDIPLTPGARRAVKSVGTGAQQFSRGDFASKFLRLFRGARRQELGLLEFYDIRDCAGTASGKVLLHFTDGTPAMAELSHGLGTVLMLNFSASEYSGNLVRQQAFPAWLHELMKHLTTAEAVPGAHTIGVTLTGEAWKNDLAQPFRAPDGEPIALKTEPLGERTAYSFTASAPGFYTLRNERLLHAFAVNPPADESDLRALEPAQMPAKAEGRAGYLIEGRDDVDALAHGRPLWQWFILAAAGVLVIELLFQLWLRRHAAA